jgi:hypothetical protein
LNIARYEFPIFFFKNSIVKYDKVDFLPKKRNMRNEEDQVVENLNSATINEEENNNNNSKYDTIRNRYEFQKSTVLDVKSWKRFDNNPGIVAALSETEIYQKLLENFKNNTSTNINYNNKYFKIILSKDQGYNYTGVVVEMIRVEDEQKNDETIVINNNKMKISCQRKRRNDINKT